MRERPGQRLRSNGYSHQDERFCPRQASTGPCCITYMRCEAPCGKALLLMMQSESLRRDIIGERQALVPRASEAGFDGGLVGLAGISIRACRELGKGWLRMINPVAVGELIPWCCRKSCWCEVCRCVMTPLTLGKSERMGLSAFRHCSNMGRDCIKRANCVQSLSLDKPKEPPVPKTSGSCHNKWCGVQDSNL